MKDRVGVELTLSIYGIRRLEHAVLLDARQTLLGCLLRKRLPPLLLCDLHLVLPFLDLLPALILGLLLLLLPLLDRLLGLALEGFRQRLERADRDGRRRGRGVVDKGDRDELVGRWAGDGEDFGGVEPVVRVLGEDLVADLIVSCWRSGRRGRGRGSLGRGGGTLCLRPRVARRRRRQGRPTGGWLGRSCRCWRDGRCDGLSGQVDELLEF